MSKKDSFSINSEKELIERLDEWCSKKSYTRSSVVNLLIRVFLDQEEGVEEKVQTYRAILRSTKG